MGKSDRDTYEEMYFHIRESILIYAREIYDDINPSYETNDKSIIGIAK